jgi:hypothetical protein
MSMKNRNRPSNWRLVISDRVGELADLNLTSDDLRTLGLVTK